MKSRGLDLRLMVGHRSSIYRKD